MHANIICCSFPSLACHAAVYNVGSAYHRTALDVTGRHNMQGWGQETVLSVRVANIDSMQSQCTSLQLAITTGVWLFQNASDNKESRTTVLLCNSTLGCVKPVLQLGSHGHVCHSSCRDSNSSLNQLCRPQRSESSFWYIPSHQVPATKVSCKCQESRVVLAKDCFRFWLVSRQLTCK